MTLKNFFFWNYLSLKISNAVLQADNGLETCGVAFKSTLPERERMDSPGEQFLTLFMDGHVVVQQMLPALVTVVEWGK